MIEVDYGGCGGVQAILALWRQSHVVVPIYLQPAVA